MSKETSRQFHLGDILSVTTGRLVSPTHMDGIYSILNFMTGDQLFTNQLPRACDECRPHLMRQLSWLEEIREEGCSTDTWQAWLAGYVEQYGAYHEVDRIPRDDHEVIDPIDELRRMKPDAQIIVVDPNAL